MSKTFKKFPSEKSTGPKTGKYFKRKANKKVRRSDVPDGNTFKKIFESWNIIDYKYIAYNDSDAIKYINKKNNKSKHRAKINNEIHTNETIRKAE